MPEPRNVLFIVIDQLRADCLHGALAAHVELPHLRALMGEAVTFTNHFSVTSPCGPSRASLLTGQYAMNHRSVRNGTPLRHDTPSIATEMRKAGYRPMLFGYTDTSQDPRVHDRDDPALRTYESPMTGFDEELEMRSEVSLPWRAHLRERGYTFEDLSDLYIPVAPEGRTPRVTDPALYAAEDSDTAFLTDRFLDRMQHCDDSPWFAHLTYFRPHPPLVAPAPYNGMYDPSALPLPQRLPSPVAEAAQHPFLGPVIDRGIPRDIVRGIPDLAPGDETVQALRAVYLGLASEVDHHIGRVLRYLEESGQDRSTMLVVTADHGEMLGDRYCWGKMTVYDAAYHVPLIIRLPGAEADGGTVVDLPTESVDVAPTILDWVGREAPNAMDGRSLLPFLQGETQYDWRRHTVSELDFGDPEAPSLWQAWLGTPVSDANLTILRDARYTLVDFAAELPPLLFDRDGKGEGENLAEDPAHAAELYRLTRLMLQHRMRHMDQTLALDYLSADGARRLSRRDARLRRA